MEKIPSVILKGEKLEAFSLESGAGQGYPSQAAHTAINSPVKTNPGRGKRFMCFNSSHILYILLPH